MVTQAEKGLLFRELHQRPGILILPNPWDAGTAKLLASLGFVALATTSLGMANALGRVDGVGSLSRAELLENCRVIAEATDLPVNADLENGYADDPQEAATILRDAAEMGVVGGSIEDWSGERIYDFSSRGRARGCRRRDGSQLAGAVHVCCACREFDPRSARSGRYHQTPASLREGRRRRALRAWAPRSGRPCAQSVQAVGKPLNVVMSAADPTLIAAEMEAVSVKRLSVVGALSRLALARS